MVLELVSLENGKFTVFKKQFISTHIKNRNKKKAPSRPAPGTMDYN